MKMPVLFVGHGSPMNAIEHNVFTDKWKEIGRSLPRPKVILVVSAHWVTQGIRTSNAVNPKLVYDMYGFPKALYDLKYPVKGSSELADQIVMLFGEQAIIDNKWGIDHGAWSVLNHMFPQADIPVVQLSLNQNVSLEAHYQFGKMISDLRNQEILIIGSGNVVHNLALTNFEMEKGYPWAHDFDDYIKSNIINNNHDAVVHYKRAGKSSESAFYTLEHFLPLLYVLGVTSGEDQIEVFNERCLMGSLSMTSYLFTPQK